MLQKTNLYWILSFFSEDFSPTELPWTQIAQRPVALVRPNFPTEGIS